MSRPRSVVGHAAFLRILRLAKWRLVQKSHAACIETVNRFRWSKRENRKGRIRLGRPKSGSQTEVGHIRQLEPGLGFVCRVCVDLIWIELIWSDVVFWPGAWPLFSAIKVNRQSYGFPFIGWQITPWLEAVCFGLDNLDRDCLESTLRSINFWHRSEPTCWQMKFALETHKNRGLKTFSKHTWWGIPVALTDLRTVRRC